MSAAQLAIAERAITVIVGLPGSGKTDLIRSRWVGVRRGAAYQPQRPYLFRGLMGMNLGLGLTAEQCGLAGQYARRFGLESRLAEPALVATDDERARLTLARTLARSETLVLLDEPLGSVAPKWRSTVIEVLGDALRDRTALVATTDPGLAVNLAERLAILVAGRVVRQGDVGEVVVSEWWPIA